MKRVHGWVAGLVLASLPMPMAFAADQGVRTQAQQGVQERATQRQMTTGSQLMTPGERREHRRAMRTMSHQEREAYRRRHHERMKKRAGEQGKRIPDRAPAGGMGMGRGGGMGSGMGPGGPGR